MDLAQTLATDVQALLAAVVGGFWLALGAIFGTAVAGAVFSVALAAAKAPARASRRSVRNAWR